VTQLPIPLFSAQRVSTRFIVVPATMLVLLAAMRMQDFLVRDKPTHTAKSVIVLFLVLMAWGLYLHSSTWRIYSADLFFLNDDVYGAGPESVRAPALENFESDPSNGWIRPPAYGGEERSRARGSAPPSER
jgi:hypothetical protein